MSSNLSGLWVVTSSTNSGYQLYGVPEVLSDLTVTFVSIFFTNSVYATNLIFNSSNNTWEASNRSPRIFWKRATSTLTIDPTDAPLFYLNGSVISNVSTNSSTTEVSGMYNNTTFDYMKSTNDNRTYLSYVDSDSKVKLVRELNNEMEDPLIDLSSVTNLFVKSEYNASTGNIHMVYNDGEKCSVKVYKVVAPIAKYYVDANVSGGDGSGDSWVNAMDNFQDALESSGSITTEIWVAKGTYSPGSNREDSFVFNTNGLSVYGGFNGTETALTERDIAANPTILSGDVNNNDTVVDFATDSGSSRIDNNHYVTQITANNITLDGFSIEDGDAVHAGNGFTQGSAIKIASTVLNPTIQNCEINNNVTYGGGAIYAYHNVSTTININNCIFNNNISRSASGLYIIANNNANLTLNLTNNLFSNNISKNYSTNAKGYTGSSAWIVGNGSNSSITSTITNCTFANNMDIGTINTVTERGTLGLSLNQGTHNSIINNCIFYGNTGTGNTTTLAVSKGHESAATQTIVNNSIDEDNFSNLVFKSNTSNSDPLFADITNHDFSLQANSPAIDTGDNTKIPAGITTDLLGNNRIYNTTVDMGAYEKEALLDGTLTTNTTNGTISVDVASTNGSYTGGTVIELIATPDVGYQFDGWSGDASGTTNPLSVTMDGDKSITAVFILIPCNINIPDANFKAALVANKFINTDENTEISCDEAIAYTGTVSVQNKGITDATGIEAFVNATKIWLNSNSITSLDVSNNLAITSLYLSGNSLTSLDVSKNVLLEKMNFSNNDLSSLNVAIGSRSNTLFWNDFDIEGNPNLTCVTVSNLSWANQNWIQKDSQVSYSLNCNDPIQQILTTTTTTTNGTVTTNVAPTNGTYDYETVVELTATPDAGYQFDGWSGDATGTTNPLSITMDADKSVTAMFSLIQQALTTTATNGTVTADVTPTNGTYDFGTVVVLTETPGAGYQFDGWSGDATGTTNPLTITMDADKNITATFSLIQQHTLIIDAVNGSITIGSALKNKGEVKAFKTSEDTPKSSETVDSTTNNGQAYDFGTELTLTATPDAGYQFDGWSGDATGVTNPLTITMDADKNITAIFSVDDDLSIRNSTIDGLIVSTKNQTIVTNLSEVSVTVYDSSGKQVANQYLNGLYIVLLKDDKGNNQIEKILITE